MTAEDAQALADAFTVVTAVGGAVFNVFLIRAAWRYIKRTL
jgi:hypothetical protein